MRINDPRNVYGEKLLSENEISNTYLSKNTASSTYLSKSSASSTYLSQASASSTYATKSALTPLATKSEVANTYLSQNDASSTYLSQSSASSTYATKTALNNKADKSQLEAKADKSDLTPLATKNEVSAKVDTSSLVSNTIKVTKENTNDIITITSSDVADITNWEIYKITGTLTDGTVISLIADAVISADGLTINLGDGSGRATDIASVDIKLIRENSQGVEEVSLEVLLSTGLASGNIALLDMAVDKVIATGDVEQIQAVGAQLAASGIEEYTLAGSKTGDEVVALMIGSNNGAFSSPIAYIDSNEEVTKVEFQNDIDFGYNLMSLESSAIDIIKFITNSQTVQTYASSRPTQPTVPAIPPGMITATAVFEKCSSLTSFTSKLSSLTNGQGMFSYCYNLTSFTSELPNLTDGWYMFENCNNLTSFTSELPSLTKGESMFGWCRLDLASVQNIARTINTYNGNLTLGLGCTSTTFNDHSTGWYDAVKTIENKGWTVAVQYNG